MVVIKNTSNFNQRMSQILRLDLSVWLALNYIVFKRICKSGRTFRLLDRYGFCGKGYGGDEEFVVLDFTCI